MTEDRARLIGVGCAVGAALSFSANDMLIKLFSDDYPLHQIVLIRALVAMAINLAIFVPLDGGFSGLRTKRPLMHMARGLSVVIANVAFFAGLAAMPLGQATAIFFISPLLIAALSALFLGETVGPRRWAAIGVGFLGVMIIIRPAGVGFDEAALLPMIAALGYALLHVMTRKLGMSERASSMSFYIQLIFILVSGGFGLIAGDGRYAGQGHPSLEFLFAPWVWPASGDWTLLVLIGVASAIGGYLISQAYRQAEAGLIAPFEYVAFVMALVWGFVIWGEVPDAVAWGGMTLVLGAGLFLALREAKLGARISMRRSSGRR